MCLYETFLANCTVSMDIIFTNANMAIGIEPDISLIYTI